MNVLSAALDLSSHEGSFAFARDGGIFEEKRFPVFGRDGAKFAGLLIDGLKNHGLEIKDIDFWTVGSGPGSFSGLRLAAALTQGFVFGSKAQSRCVPGAVSYASQAGLAGEQGGVLFDGRNSEILFFGVKKVDGEWRPDGVEKVLNRAGAEEFFASYHGECAVPAQDAEAVKKIFTPAVLKTAKFQISDLLNYRGQDFDGDLTRMVYIRPAVYA